MSDEDIENEKQPFDFEGEMSKTEIRGLDYNGIFSPSLPISDMPKHVEEQIKRVRKLRRKTVFPEPFKA